jgi:hypothetical protein
MPLQDDEKFKGTGVVVQKFAPALPRVHRANFCTKNNTRIMKLLVSLSNPKFAPERAAKQGELRIRDTSVAIFVIVCHKAAFVARLNKGCRGDDQADILAFCEKSRDFNALTSIFRPDARPRDRLLAGIRRAKCPS